MSIKQRLVKRQTATAVPTGRKPMKRQAVSDDNNELVQIAKEFCDMFDTYSGAMLALVTEIIDFDESKLLDACNLVMFVDMMGRDGKPQNEEAKDSLAFYAKTHNMSMDEALADVNKNFDTDCSPINADAVVYTQAGDIAALTNDGWIDAAGKALEKYDESGDALMYYIDLARSEETNDAIEYVINFWS